MTGGRSIEKKGGIALVDRFPRLSRDNDLSINMGSENLVVKYEKNPEKSVEPYAIKAVIPSNLPAPLPRSAIPGATNPRMINGITNPRKLLNIELNVTKILTSETGKTKDEIIPRIIAIIILVRSPVLNLIIPFVLLFKSFLF